MMLGQILARLDAMERQHDRSAADRDVRLTAIEEKLDSLSAKEIRRDGQQSILLWLGAGIIAAAGGTGAFTAKALGWIVIK